MRERSRPLPRLPWDEVNARDAADVAALLGLEQGRERRKFTCPFHGGTSLHAYPDGGFVCYGACAPTSGAHASWSNVDFYAEVERIDPAEACKRLAEHFGLLLPDLAPRQTRKTRRRRPNAPRASRTPRKSANAVHRPKHRAGPDPDDDVLRDRAEVYRFVLDTLPLTDRGAEYLRGRGLDVDASRTYGFRSLDGSRYWTRLGEVLAETFEIAQLERAGFWKDGEYVPRWRGRAPALVIPYWDMSGRVVGLRFRRLDDGPGKYNTLPGAQPPLPFGANPSLTALAGTVLHVTEGELDAWTLACAYDQRAIGVPGVKNWRAGWARLLRSAGRVVIWYDADESGRQGVQAVADRLAIALGHTWVRDRCVQQPLPDGYDVNDLHQQGTLNEYVQRYAEE